MLNSLISDALARIRNGYMSKKSSVEVLHSNFVQSVLKVLQKEGYIGNLSMVEKQPNAPDFYVKKMNVELTYVNKSSSTKEIKLISKPGCKRYIKTSELLTFYNKFCHSGLGTVILSTNKGILTGHEALQKNAGGELICRVF